MKSKIKKLIIKDYIDIIQRYKIIFIIKNNRSRVSDIVNLKKSLEKKKCKIIMIKKSLMKIAIKNTKFNNVENKFEGANILIFSNLIFETSKTIVELLNKQWCFIAIGGAYEKKTFDRNTIFDIGKLKDNELKINTINSIRMIAYNIIQILTKPSINILNLLKERK